jgi:hypothetical protein
MLAKTQEKLSETAFLFIATGLGLFLFQGIFKDASPETKESFLAIAQGLGGVLILGLVWGVTKLKSHLYRPGITFQPKGIVRPEGYQLPTSRVTFFGVLLFIAGSQLLAFLTGSLIAITLLASGLDPTNDGDLFLSAAIPSLLYGQAITAYLVGRWIGARVASHGLLVVLAVVLIGRVLVSIFDSLLGYGTFFLDPITLGIFILITALIGSIGVLGYWHGFKAREACYIWYLLSNLPSDSREPIESLLYDEVRAQASAGN